MLRSNFVTISDVNFETKSWFLSKFCTTLQFHERLFFCIFFFLLIYTLLKRSTLKLKFLRVLSARIKFCPIPNANFETTTGWLSKFWILLQFDERLFLCTFLLQPIHTLLKRSTLKSKLFRLSSARVKFVKFLMSILKRKVDFCPDFVSLLTVMAQGKYTFFKRNSLKSKFLRLWSARGKFRQIHYANFETTTQ